MKSYRYLSMILLVSTALASAAPRVKKVQPTRKKTKTTLTSTAPTTVKPEHVPQKVTTPAPTKSKETVIPAKVENVAPVENTNTDVFQAGNATETIEQVTAEKIEGSTEPILPSADTSKPSVKHSQKEDDDDQESDNDCEEGVEVYCATEDSEANESALQAFKDDLKNELDAKVLEVIARHPEITECLKLSDGKSQEPHGKIDYTYVHNAIGAQGK